MKSQKILILFVFLFIFSSIIQVQNGKSANCNCSDQYLPTIILKTPQYSNIWGDNISLSWGFYANNLVPPTDTCVINFTLQLPDGTNAIHIITNTTVSLLPTSYQCYIPSSIQINDTFTINWSIGYQTTDGIIHNYHRSIMFTWIGLTEPISPVSESLFTNIYFWIVIVGVTFGIILVVLLFRKRFSQQSYQQPYQQQYIQQSNQIDCNDPQNLYNDPSCIQQFQSQYGMTPQEYSQKQNQKEIKKI